MWGWGGERLREKVWMVERGARPVMTVEHWDKPEEGASVRGVIV